MLGLVDGYKYEPKNGGVHNVVTLSGINGTRYWDPRWGGCWQDFTSTDNKRPYYRGDDVIRWFYDEESLYE